MGLNTIGPGASSMGPIFLGRFEGGGAFGGGPLRKSWWGFCGRVDSTVVSSPKTLLTAEVGDGGGGGGRKKEEGEGERGRGTASGEGSSAAEMFRFRTVLQARKASASLCAASPKAVDVSSLLLFIDVLSYVFPLRAVFS